MLYDIIDMICKFYTVIVVIVKSTTNCRFYLPQSTCKINSTENLQIFENL